MQVHKLLYIFFSFTAAKQPLDLLWTASVEPIVTRQYCSLLEKIYWFELGFWMHVLMKPVYSFMDETSCVCVCVCVCVRARACAYLSSLKFTY